MNQGVSASEGSLFTDLLENLNGAMGANKCYHSVFQICMDKLENWNCFFSYISRERRGISQGINQSTLHIMVPKAVSAQLNREHLSMLNACIQKWFVTGLQENSGVLHRILLD